MVASVWGPLPELLVIVALKLFALEKAVAKAAKSLLAASV
jgi:hypothetical protein